MFERVQQGINAAQRIIIFSGAGVSTSDLKSPGGLWTQTFESGSKTCRWSRIIEQERRGALDERELLAFNRLMAEQRAAAARAPLSRFHVWARFLEEDGRVKRYVTRNYDALETRDHPDSEASLLRLHGDNRFVICTSPSCQKEFAADLRADWERKFLTERPVYCPDCSQNDRGSRRVKNRGKSSSLLRPAISFGNEVVGTPGEELVTDLFLEQARACDLFLIVGTSLSSDAVSDAIRRLAVEVQDGQGAVVYIDKAPIPRRWVNCVNIHLRLDIEECAARFQSTYPTFNPRDPGESATSIWEEVLETIAVPRELPPVADVERIVCNLCLLGVPSELVACVQCGAHFCIASVDNGRTSSCVLLNYFSAGPPQGHEDYVCHLCPWDESKGLYPHFVRPQKVFLVPPPATPRLVLLVYYLGQFWPIAQHLVDTLSANWALQGWECIAQPIKLQELGEYPVILPNFAWDPKTYQVLVVYITHGLSGSGRLQMHHAESYDAVEFFTTTLCKADGILSKASSTQAIVISCGHIYRRKETTYAIHKWVQGGGPLDRIVGCLNTRLASAYMVDFVVKASVEMLGFDDWTMSGVFQAWMRSDSACTHSDLIYFSKTDPVVMWLFSPFQTRPLGKPLPSLIGKCTCPKGPLIPLPEGAKGQKIWKVTWRGAVGSSLDKITVKATCSLCGQTWQLPTENMVGTLLEVSGLYAVEVPFFV
ncbi:hypothetical protein FS749_007349 [Ceratobasidium sp. UAMH 11750]|nr:hypothetical protein FS749_007349 [Ceratobasidium sp. UAMH 11750]